MSRRFYAFFPELTTFLIAPPRCSHELARQLQEQEDQRARELHAERQRQHAEREQQERLDEMSRQAREAQKKDRRSKKKGDCLVM